MKDKSSNHFKLGIFVLIATTCLILGLYMIGNKKNVFHSAIKVSASFSDVGGLLPGNNVRFNGINVGTVAKVYATSDTTIRVDFTIDEDQVQFVSKNSIASIGTDGLLGNKIVNIGPGRPTVAPVKDGDVLASINPIQMDKAMRTLTQTNDNLEVISSNLKGVTEKINKSNTLWSLLSDTVLAQNIKNAIVTFKITGENTAMVTGDLRTIVREVKNGKGSLGALLMDTLLTYNLRQTIIKINSISDTVALITGDFKSFSGRLKRNEGAVGTLLTDTNFVHNLNSSMKNIKDASSNFNENLEALKVSWPFKKYFKQQKSSVKQKR